MSARLLVKSGLYGRRIQDYLSGWELDEILACSHHIQADPSTKYVLHHQSPSTFPFKPCT